MDEDDRGKPGLGPEEYPMLGTGCSKGLMYELDRETLGLGVLETAGDRCDGGV